MADRWNNLAPVGPGEETLVAFAAPFVHDAVAAAHEEGARVTAHCFAEQSLETHLEIGATLRASSKTDSSTLSEDTIERLIELGYVR